MLANPGIRVTQIAHRLDVFGSPATPYPYIPAARTANTPAFGEAAALLVKRMTSVERRKPTLRRRLDISKNLVCERFQRQSA